MVANHTVDQADHSVIIFHNHFSTIKLDKSKFIVWKQQILHILLSLDLESFLANQEIIRHVFGFKITKE